MQAEAQHHRLRDNGITHHYVTAGDGPPLVLIHGFPQTWLAWRRLIDRLAGRFRIIAPDLRGLGGVPAPPWSYDKHSLASDVHAILRAEEVDEPVAMCGHDMGAYVAYAYALTHRAEVGSLVLVDGALPGTTVGDGLPGNPRTWHIRFHGNVEVAEMLIHSREQRYLTHFIRSRGCDRSAISDADIDAYVAVYSAPGALRSALEMYRAFDTDSRLNHAALDADGRLTMPVVYVANGVVDVEGLPGMVEEIAVDGRLAVIERCGHWIPEERPERLAEIITDTASRADTLKHR